MARLSAGTAAPDFSMSADDGSVVSRDGQLGKR
jgi:peroxiredoxin